MCYAVRNATNIGEKAMSTETETKTRVLSSLGDTVCYTVDTVNDVKIARLRNFVLGSECIGGKVDIDENDNILLFDGFTNISRQQFQDVADLINDADTCFYQHDEEDDDDNV